MSFQVDTAFVNQFKDNLDILVQQNGSRLRNAVRVEMQKGEKAFYERISSTSMQEKTTRHGDTPLIHTPHDRRMVTTTHYEWADLIDDPDRIYMLVDPQGPYLQNAAMAAGRTQDEVIIAAAFGTAKSGKSGTTSVSFPASQQIAVNDHTFDSGSGDVGLTLGKLIHARKILMGNEAINPNDQLYIAVNAMQMAKLLTDSSVQSIDTNTVRALVAGEISSFMGFNFIHTELLDVDSNSDDRIIAWAKSGLLLSVGEDITVRVSERDDKSYATQVFVRQTVGATRMEEEKVVEIKCDPA